jgi:integrase
MAAAKFSRMHVDQSNAHRTTWGRTERDPRVGTEPVAAEEFDMAYIVQRNHRFYVVSYDGIDPITGRHRRRWHPAGRSREDAQAIVARLATDQEARRQRLTSRLTVGSFLVDTWMPLRRRELRPGTANRYEWIIRNYIAPVVGDLQLTSLRAEQLDRLYTDLVDRGAANGGPLASKTVYEVHVVIRSALRHATRCRLVDHNVAIDAHPPRPTTRSRPSPEIWSTEQLAQFLDRTTHLRLHRALHLAATTGLRRGELAGLRWADWQPATHRLPIARSRQSVGGRAVEIPTKTAASRRCIDLDATTEHILRVWRQRQRRDRLPAATDDPIFTNTVGEPLHPESITQVFDRQVARLGLPRIRFHDLRHTHASLLVAAGAPIKVVSERLGHAHPGFTMATYQHLLPGMGAAAARDFAALLAAAGAPPTR